MPHLYRVIARGDEIGRALGHVHHVLLSESRAESEAAAIAIQPTLGAVMGTEAAADVVSALVKLAALAARQREAAAARRLLFHVLALAVGDPHDVLFERDGLAAFRPDAARTAAFRALESELAAVAAIATEPEAPHPADADDAACGLSSHPGLVRTARLLCAFAVLSRGADPHTAIAKELRARIDAEAREWSRGGAFVWRNGEGERAAELVARDPAEPALVRAAAIIGAAADDIARGNAPRADLLGLFADVVAPDHHSWGQLWAPLGLFAEQGDRLHVALLSPAARVRFGVSAPLRVEQVARALLAALDLLPDHERQRAALAGNLLGFTFGARAAPWPAPQLYDLVVPTPEELSPFEREILDAVARKVSPLEWDFDVHHNLFEVGLPASYTGLRRWFGIDPPGPANTPIEVLVDGQSRVLPLELAVQRMLLGRVDASDISRAMARVFSPAALLYVTTEAFMSFDARHHCTGPTRDDAQLQELFDEICLAALEERTGAVMVPLILERLDRVLDGFMTEVRGGAVQLLFRALARLLEPGATIPERFDALLATLPNGYRADPKGVREVLARVDQDRRDRIVRKAAAAFVITESRADFSDLVSPATRAIMAHEAERPATAIELLGQSLVDAVRRGVGGRTD